LLNFQYNIVNFPAYRAVGLKWDGTWTEISDLKEVIHSMGERMGELQYAVNPDIQLGLSYHSRPDGFVHYSVYEVIEEQKLPVGMIEIKVPEMTYLRTQHKKGENIGQTYQNISQWMNESDYKPFEEPNIKYYDELPIKHEKYPHDRDLNDPHFEILIPIVKKI
jgi:predicted transcriptional regulator YdeE